MPASRDNRKHDPRKHKSAPVPTKPEAGARPLSERQRTHLAEQKAHLSHLHAAHAHRPETVLRREIISVQTNRFRSGAATMARQREKRRSNYRKVDWAKLLLRLATTAFCLEFAAVLFWSPRLWLHSVSFTGNTTIPTERLVRRLALPANANLLAMLWRSKQLVQSLRSEPSVETVSIHPTLSPGLAVRVVERVPFAAVTFDSEPGRWYTIDAGRVPFRVWSGLPEAGLPLICVATHGAAGTTLPVKLRLGSVCNTPGLSDVGICLAWAKSQGANFPVEKVTIDNAGKLCLNRAGGMKVLLGPGLELSEKLNTLSLLLKKRTDLRGSAPTDIVAVNLYAYDAPALVPRVGAAPGQMGEQTGETAAQ